MKLSIIIPVYNEAETIKAVVAKVMQANSLGHDKQIIIVDDGSTDVTALRLAELASCTIVHHHSNQGKGAAIKSGLLHAQGDMVLIQDADSEYDPGDYPALLEPFSHGAQVVYGVRTYKPQGKGYWPYVLGAWGMDIVFWILFGQKIHDIYTGYKVFRSDVIKAVPLISDGFEIEAEITAGILNKKIPIIEVPIHYYPRTFQAGKKIRARDGWKGVLTLVKYRFIKKAS